MSDPVTTPEKKSTSILDDKHVKIATIAGGVLLVTVSLGGGHKKQFKAKDRAEAEVKVKELL